MERGGLIAQIRIESRRIIGQDVQRVSRRVVARSHQNTADETFLIDHHTASVAKAPLGVVVGCIKKIVSFFMMFSFL